MLNIQYSSQCICIVISNVLCSSQSNWIWCFDVFVSLATMNYQPWSMVTHVDARNKISLYIRRSKTFFCNKTCLRDPDGPKLMLQIGSCRTTSYVDWLTVYSFCLLWMGSTVGALVILVCDNFFLLVIYWDERLHRIKCCSSQRGLMLGQQIC